MTMRERIARAIGEAAGNDFPGFWDDAADAVLAAMAEPTEAMKQVLMGSGSDGAIYAYPGKLELWRAMIEAARAEQSVIVESITVDQAIDQALEEGR